MRSRLCKSSTLSPALILLFGRPLYWALVALLGFVIGFEFAGNLGISDSQLIQGLIAVGVGIVAALLAVAFQWLAFGLVGFLSGCYLVQIALTQYELAGNNNTAWIIIGGVIGAVIALLLVDWAIIILSSLAGATMIAAEIPVEHQIRLAILAGLAIAGIIFQRTRLTRSQMRAP